MRKLKKWLAGLALLAIAALIGVFLYLVVSPPALLRVGAGYASKITCSSAFVSGRDPAQVFETDVQTIDPILGIFSQRADPEARSITSAIARVIAPATAVYRPGLGCALAPEGNLARASAQSAPPAPGPTESAALWPEGEGAAPADALDAIITDEALAGPGMRAIVVIHNGRIAAERYGPGFTAQTPLLGWSMSKTVTAALTGTVIGAGHLSLDQAHLLPQWTDDRAEITVEQLLSMSSGLRFNEDYGDVSDVTRMLYLEPDMAAFAAGQPLDAAPGTRFSYSSGTSVILSRIWQNAVGADALAWPRTHLFDPIGMGSAVFETDVAGTFTGSSYLYATARDWARFGLLLLQEGRWQGAQILPEGFATMMMQPSEASAVYGKGMIWMDGPGGEDRAGADAGFGLPEDASWMLGHDGQSVAVVPSAGLVVVRMGLTPSSLGYRPQKLVAALIGALPPS